jgi:hypothetical protein
MDAKIVCQADRVEVVAIGSVTQDPSNVRRHNERNLEAIMASLRRFGQQKPVVVDDQGVVRAGNGTVLAATKLGWESIAIVRSDLEGAAATAYAIADNRTTDLSEFDGVALTDFLGAVGDHIDLLAAMGFTAQERKDLLGEGENWGAFNDEQVGEYDAQEDTYVVKIAGVDADMAALIAKRVNAALEGTPYHVAKD